MIDAPKIGLRRMPDLQDRVVVPIAELDQRVLDRIRERLLAPDATAEFLRVYHEERKHLAVEGRRRQALSRQHADLDRQIGNIIDAIAEGIATRAMKARLVELEGEKESLVAELAASEPDNVVELHPATVEAYRKMVAELRAGLAASNEETRCETQEVLRSLIETIELHPGEMRGETIVTVRGRIAELINLPGMEPRQAARTVSLAEGGSS